MEYFTHSNAMQLFLEFDGMHRAWKAFHPGGSMNKSALGLLGLIHHMEHQGYTKITVGDLASMGHHSPPAISQKVNLLEKAGYLVRSSDPTDRRICYVQMTETGRAAASEGFQRFMRHMELALAELGPEQTKMLLQLIHELTEAMTRQADKQADKKTPMTH